MTAGVRDRRTAYAPPEADIPLRGYAGVIATFSSIGAAALAVAARRGLPERIGLSDLALLSVGLLIAGDRRGFYAYTHCPAPF